MSARTRPRSKSWAGRGGVGRKVKRKQEVKGRTAKSASAWAVLSRSALRTVVPEAAPPSCSCASSAGSCSCRPSGETRLTSRAGGGVCDCSTCAENSDASWRRRRHHLPTCLSKHYMSSQHGHIYEFPTFAYEFPTWALAIPCPSKLCGHPMKVHGRHQGTSPKQYRKDAESHQPQDMCGNPAAQDGQHTPIIRRRQG